ncbi:MAG: MFS transporter [Devosia sp.]
MTRPTNSWAELFSTGGLAIAIIAGGTGLQAIEGFIASSMLPTVVKDIGGLQLFAWNTTLFVVASIMATLFAAVRPASIGPRLGYIISAAAFGIGSLICGLAPDMIVLLTGRFVQGFGAGLIIAQSFAMLRLAFPEHLWPRAMALNATIWGVATLLGPAAGGIFAELGLWRWAFLAIVPASTLLAASAWRVLPARGETHKPARFPLKQIFLVTAAVLDISIASLLTGSPDIAAALVMFGLLGILLLGLADTYSRTRLLPEGAFSPTSPMSGLLALVLVLGLTITSDIFAPLFLQRLHGLSPLSAGYITALAAGGWSLAAIIGSGWTGVRVRIAMLVAPVLMLMSTLGLAAAFFRPAPGDWPPLALASISLFLLGSGIGLAFQHLSTRVLASARPGENDRVSAALGMVQLFASGLGAAFGGVIVNAAGLPHAANSIEVAISAQWLYGGFALIAALGIPFALLVPRGVGREARLQAAE